MSEKKVDLNLNLKRTALYNGQYFEVTMVSAIERFHCTSKRDVPHLWTFTVFSLSHNLSWQNGLPQKKISVRWN